MINALLKRRMENKKKNKKGFTLVELIVVLVILAILMAVLVPTLTGYISKAKRTAVETATKNIVTAATSAGVNLCANTDTITASTTTGNDFVTEIKEVGGTSILEGVDKIIIDSATGSPLFVAYTNGTYSCVYYVESGKADYTSKKTTTFGDISTYTKAGSVGGVTIVSGGGYSNNQLTEATAPTEAKKAESK